MTGGAVGAGETGVGKVVAGGRRGEERLSCFYVRVTFPFVGIVISGYCMVILWRNSVVAKEGAKVHGITTGSECVYYYSQR